MHDVVLYRSLFKGREDVFAIHWSKGKKNGYMPAYHYDPYLYRQHKFKGGTFKDFKDKQYELFTDQQLVKHLNGEQLVGVYPLLKDNTSWFIVADFDKQHWLKESRAFIKKCAEYDLKAYLERSRSGNGGHVWVFFKAPYSAHKSRRIMTVLLEKSGTFSAFDKTSSFDRLFPNQDYHSGKGLGNLIALPLHKIALDEGNSCFIQSDSSPYVDQWDFLNSIERISTAHMEKLFERLIAPKAHQKEDRTSFPSKKTFTLSNKIRINRYAINADLLTFLKDELNIPNTYYFIKRNSSKNTWGTQRYFNFIKETQDEITVPRGFIGRLLRYNEKKELGFKLNDRRKKLTPVKFNCSFTLKAHQKSAIQATEKKHFGVIVSPPGSGKTIMALRVIADKQQPALIVVHRKQLLDQWADRIEGFLGIPKREIGKIGRGKAKLGEKITIAMIQSLGKYFDKAENQKDIDAFGTIVIDECHHIGAETYHKTISKLKPYFQYGLTATPFRRGSNDRIIFIHLGELIADIKPEQVEQYKRARIIIRQTDFDVPYNSKTDPFEVLSRMLIHDSERNKLVLKDVRNELAQGKKVVIITERKEHIEALNQFLKQSYETITLSGADTEKERAAKWKSIENQNYQAIITTGQYFGEGTDIQNVSTLFLVYPFAFRGKLIQYMGRVQRSEIAPRIYDYHDRKVDYLHRMFLKRNTHYRFLDKQAGLFDDPDENVSSASETFVFQKQTRISIEELDFRYGSIAFKYAIPNVKPELEFEVENDNVRPEFDVLKPFFSKFLKSKLVRVSIHAEFQESTLVAQSANSDDLENINREIIESVKFRFIEKKFFGLQYDKETDQTLLDLEQLQKVQESGQLYDSEEELLGDLLNNKAFKHYHQLRYLSSNHEKSVLKLRFILSPFSFVFLLEGESRYHVVLETLDTEEATYIWHIEKDKSQLKGQLKIIDNDLTFIRNKGRQLFLDNAPSNFSRIHHDYSDDRKGFVVWRDMLEERLA